MRKERSGKWRRKMENDEFFIIPKANKTQFLTQPKPFHPSLTDNK